MANLPGFLVGVQRTSFLIDAKLAVEGLTPRCPAKHLSIAHSRKRRRPIAERRAGQARIRRGVQSRTGPKLFTNRGLCLEVATLPQKSTSCFREFTDHSVSLGFWIS